MSGMDDLETWLRAQLDEDAGLARMAFAEHNRAIAEWHEPSSGTVEIGPDEDDLCCNDSGVSRHIVNWDPARALAEVDAKRRIIDEHQAVDGYDPNGPVCATCGERGNPGDEDAVVRWPCRTVRLLAPPYADRPGYREEWRP